MQATGTELSVAPPTVRAMDHNDSLPADLVGDQTRGLVWPTLTDVGMRCTWTADGMSVACGPRRPRRLEDMSYDEVMAVRQASAGEEDQSVRGWDQGA